MSNREPFELPIEIIQGGKTRKPGEVVYLTPDQIQRIKAAAREQEKDPWDCWLDELVADGLIARSDRRKTMDVTLIRIGWALAQGKAIPEPYSEMLAWSLHRMADGSDPGSVFGPVRGPYKSLKERSIKPERDHLIARQAVYLFAQLGWEPGRTIKRGDRQKVIAALSKLHHKGPRLIEKSIDKHRKVAEALWESCRLHDSKPTAPIAGTARYLTPEQTPPKIS